MKDVDLEEALRYAQNLMFRDLGEYIEAELRKEVFPDLSICFNCKNRQNNICTEKMESIHSFCEACQSFRINPESHLEL